VRHAIAVWLLAWTAVISTGASSVAPRGTYTNAPPDHSELLRAAK
jgi:hypothetical protein